jgi:hypothetical protein
MTPSKIIARRPRRSGQERQRVNLLADGAAYLSTDGKDIPGRRAAKNAQPTTCLKNSSKGLYATILGRRVLIRVVG